MLILNPRLERINNGTRKYREGGDEGGAGEGICQIAPEGPLAGMSGDSVPTLFRAPYVDINPASVVTLCPPLVQD